MKLYDVDGCIMGSDWEGKFDCEGGFPSYEDNLIATYSALVSRSVDRIVWVVDDPSVEPPVRLHRNTQLVKQGRILDLYFSMTSRFLFMTHGHLRYRQLGFEDFSRFVRASPHVKSRQ